MVKLDPVIELLLACSGTSTLFGIFMVALPACTHTNHDANRRRHRLSECARILQEGSLPQPGWEEWCIICSDLCLVPLRFQNVENKYLLIKSNDCDILRTRTKFWVLVSSVQSLLTYSVLSLDEGSWVITKFQVLLFHMQCLIHLLDQMHEAESSHNLPEDLHFQHNIHKS